MKPLLLIFGLLTIVRSQEVILNQKPPHPVLRFTFEVNLKQVNNLIGAILDSEQNGPALKEMNASSLLSSTNINNLTLDQWNMVEKRSGLNFTRMNVNKYKEIAHTLKIKTSQEYSRLMGMVDDPMSTMKAALNAINVNEMQIMYYTMMNSEGNETFFDFFNNADFSKMEEAKQLMGLSDEKFFDFCKTALLKYLPNINLQDFAHLVKNITGEVKDFNVGYENVQVGLIKSLFKVLDVNPEQDFAVIIDSYNNSIVSPLILATRVKTGGYLSTAESFNNFQGMANSYAKPFLLEHQDGQHWKYEVKTASFKNTFAEFQTTDNVLFVPKEGYVSQLDKCYYAPNEDTLVEVKAIEDKQEITVTKSNNVFVMGAPLFCDDQLVGIAESQTSSSIIFAKVPFTMVPIAPTMNQTTPKPSTSNPETNYSITVTVAVMASLDFHIISSKIPNLIAYLLMDTINGNLSETNTAGVTPRDVFEAFRLGNLSYPDFIRLIPKDKIEPPKFNVDTTLEYLDTYNVSMVGIVNTIMDKLTTIQKIEVIEALNVSFYEVQNMYLLHRNDEAKYREFFKDANITRAKIDAAIRATNFTDQELYEIIKTVVLETLSTSTLSKALDLIQNLGGYTTLQRIIAKQMITPEAFLESKKMVNLLNNFEVILSKSSAVAPIISSRNILTAEEIYDHYNDSTTKEFVSLNVSIQNHQYQVENITIYRTGYANITLGQELKDGWLSVAIDTEPKQCQMITDRGVYEVKRVGRLRESFEIILDDVVTRETFKLGAGLVCQGRLYGVASKLATSDPGRIQFAGVREGVKPLTGDKPSSGFQMSSSIILMISAIYGVTNFI